MSGRMKLGVLRKLAVNTQAKTEKIKGERARKRAKQKGKEDDFDLLHGLTNCGQTEERVVDYRSVREWFLEGLDELCGGDVDLPEFAWAVAEIVLAKRLLKTYGENRLKQAVFYMCRNWEDICRRHRRLHGLPNVRLLWAMRDQFVAESQLDGKGKRPKKASHVGEFKKGREFRGIGW